MLEGKESNLEWKGLYKMPDGYFLHVYEDKLVGGHVYVSDEIGGGVQVCHTGLVNLSTLRAVLHCEQIMADRSKEDKYGPPILQA